MITTLFTEITAVDKKLKDIFETYYNISGLQVSDSTKRVSKYLSHFKQELHTVIEYPYVDRVYRDSYYHYYASKNQRYERDCIKISLFETTVSIENFRNADQIELLNDSYLGYIVIRPTFPHVIGRSMVNPNAIKSNGFKICKTNVSTTVNGLKLNVTGFPHSSQNTETIACAETTIWSIMEYFGMKYPEYSPTLPSKISNILNNYSFERLLPSKGLRADQISYAIKQLGFGVKLYNKEAYGTAFLIILRMYIESGIPIIVAIQNKKIGHAQCVIGRNRFSEGDINNLDKGKNITKNTTVVDLESMALDYIFMDDNFPPYQIAPLENPTYFYNDTDWVDCSITNFIVPLYSKIYLDASEARAYVQTFLKHYLTALKINREQEIILKVFLASSRSYKNYCRKESGMNLAMKELIVQQNMPKFIWIAELSNRQSIKNNDVNGLLILDLPKQKYMA